MTMCNPKGVETKRTVIVAVAKCLAGPPAGSKSPTIISTLNANKFLTGRRKEKLEKCFFTFLLR